MTKDIRNKTKGIRFVIGLCCLLCLLGCQRERQYFPKDLQHLTLQIDRFDSALLTMDTTNWETSIEQLYNSFPVFTPIFVEEIMGTEREYVQAQLTDYLNDTLYGFAETNRYEMDVMQDLSAVKAELEEAFSRLHYLYPEMEIPTITMFVSGFNAKILYLPNGIGVGADLYLGSDFPRYNMVVYNYQKQTMRKECIPADVVAAYLYQNIPFTSTKSRLLEQIIYQGKLYYLMSLLLPTEPKYEVMGYKKEQWAWCEKWERQIWQLVMDKRDLFTTDRMVLTSYLNDGPFTSEVSQDAPARLGIWLGWRIVESYMRENDNVSLLELMANGDAQQILEDSHYKP